MTRTYEAADHAPSVPTRGTVRSSPRARRFADVDGCHLVGLRGEESPDELTRTAAGIAPGNRVTGFGYGKTRVARISKDRELASFPFSPAPAHRQDAARRARRQARMPGVLSLRVAR